jgi:energy-converting hydrogenase Eha subunit C
MTKWLGMIVFLISVVVSVAAASYLPIATANAYISENGPIELATAHLWFTLALALLILATGRPALLFPAFVCALAAARELDADTAFTDEGVTNLRYWARADTGSVPEKILVAVMLALILAVFVVAIRRYWRDIAKSFAAGQGWAWSVAVMVLTTPVLMLSDGAARYFYSLTGTRLDPATHILWLAFEEVGELMLPVIGFIALGQYFERVQAGQELSLGSAKSSEVPKEPEGT